MSDKRPNWIEVTTRNVELGVVVTGPMKIDRRRVIAVGRDNEYAVLILQGGARVPLADQYDKFDPETVLG